MNTDFYGIIEDEGEVVNDFASRKITIDTISDFSSKAMRFVCIDFETATPNRFACQIGVTIINQKQVGLPATYLIQPPENYFDANTSKYHHVTAEMTADAPNFGELWRTTLAPLFTSDTILVAHNASFDFDVLKRNLALYNIPLPSIAGVICTYDLTGLSLKDACGALDIPLDNHHDAGCDSLACARLLYLYLREGKEILSKFDAQVRKTKKKAPTGFRARVLMSRIREISKKCEDHQPIVDDYEDQDAREKLKTMIGVEDLERHVRYKNCVVTGVFEGISRNDLILFLLELGAKIKSGVSSRTEVLLVGNKAGATKLNNIPKANEIRARQGLPAVELIRLEDFSIIQDA